jgi:hypothetical protein
MGAAVAIGRLDMTASALRVRNPSPLALQQKPILSG